MIIYPAIDIIDGKCVRLSKGDYSLKTIYSDNLNDITKIWISNGTKFLHIVDLDGAKAGNPTNIQHILDIRKSFPNIFIQVGGGIRTKDNMENLLVTVGKKPKVRILNLLSNILKCMKLKCLLSLILAKME
jgi:phosphoribosylformimino-5-aminoimidazole carboxamide ribotide isomerase